MHIWFETSTKLNESSSRFKLVPFMDAYSRYNNIIMDLPDNNKTKFMTNVRMLQRHAIQP